MLMEKRYLSPQELSDYTGLSVFTIYLWIRQRKIPFIKKSRLIKFDRNKIDNWFQKDEIKSTNDY
jgi:excisionase family DNA binding protein